MACPRAPILDLAARMECLIVIGCFERSVGHRPCGNQYFAANHSNQDSMRHHCFHYCHYLNLAAITVADLVNSTTMASRCSQMLADSNLDSDSALNFPYFSRCQLFECYRC